MAEYLNKEVKGSGGFQNLVRALQACTINGRLSLSLEQIKKVAKYRAYCKGDGGFQGQLKRIVDTLRFVRDQLEEANL